MQHQKGVSTLVSIVIIIVVAIVVFGGVFVYQYFATPKANNQQQNPTACTEEAKICPDGSAVGRTGPNCEFAPCPAVPDQTAGWKTYTNSEYGFEIKYPTGWDNKIGSQGKMGAYSLLSLDINKNSSDFNANRASYVRLVVEDNNFVLGSRDWKNFELGQIKGSIASPGTGYEIIFSSDLGQKFYIFTKNNPEIDSDTNKILSTFKFTE